MKRISLGKIRGWSEGRTPMNGPDFDADFDFDFDLKMKLEIHVWTI